MVISGRTLSLVALGAAVAALALLAAAGPGTRLGLWGYKAGLGLFRWVVGFVALAAAAGLAGLVMGGARPVAMTAMVLAAGASTVPFGFLYRLKTAPFIHDITTDTEDPPGFAAVRARRAPGDNTTSYGGPEVAAAQRRGYPDLRPVDAPELPARAFEHAFATARGLGWEVVSADPAAGVLEATDTTPWFGFKDDVVVRVRTRDGGSRIDVRSLSRVGQSDLGANAARVRRFLRAFAAG